MVNPEISRRKFLQFTAAGAGALALKSVLPTVSKVEAASDTVQADISAEPGRFYPDGAGLRPLFDKFNLACEQHAGVRVVDFYNEWISRFELSNNPSEGLCNGLGNINVLKSGYFQTSGRSVGGQYFSRDEILGLASALHVMDGWQSEVFNGRRFDTHERSEPIFLHYMIGKYLAKLGKGVVINLDPEGDEMWARAIDKVDIEMTDLGRGWKGVSMNMRAGGYVERGESYRNLWVGYRIIPSNPYESGVFLSGSTPFSRIWHPNPNIALPDSNPVRGNVFNEAMVQTLEDLAGFKV